MTRFHAALGVLLIAGLASSALGQDVIRLKTGALVEGTIIGETEESLTLQFPGGTMELRRSQIESITRAERPEGAELARALLTLSRIPEHESFHFLYRDGHRAGYRTLQLKREARNGIPGYAFQDRLVFMSRPGASPSLDVQVIEFVDAELRPLEFACRLTSGLSSRSVEGRREGSLLRVVERCGGSTTERVALFRPEVEFPGVLLKWLATQPVPEAGYGIYRIFRPREVAFSTLTLERRRDRLTLRGRIKDVIIFRATSGGRTLETWLDLGGHVVREEIGSAHLISLEAPKVDVLAYARGEDVPEHRELELEFVSEDIGLRFLRPDHGWDLAPGDGSDSRVVSLVHPGLRATVDFFNLESLPEDSTEEGVALALLSRLQAAAEDVELDGLYPERVGDREGLLFRLGCRRRDHDLVTLGAVRLDQNRATVILAAAPEASFKLALPGFQKLLDTVRILEPEPLTPGPDPFSSAGAEDGG